MANSVPFHPYFPDNLPLYILYGNVYTNVSGQVLEIDKELVPPGHLWSRMFAERVLIGDDYERRGYITQKLIDLGHIAKTVYSPIIPPSFLYLQSYESETWFGIDAYETDIPGWPAGQDNAAFGSIWVEGVPEESIINFDVRLHYGVWFTLGLDRRYSLAMSIWTQNKERSPTMLYEKRERRKSPAITVPLAIPNTMRLSFGTREGPYYLLRINDQGQLFWTLETGTTEQTLFGRDSLFAKAVPPILCQIPTQRNANWLLEENLKVKATLNGTYTGTDGRNGTLSFQWRALDIGDLLPGLYPVEVKVGHPETTGIWTCEGTLSVER